MARFTLKRAAKYDSLKRGFRPCGRFAGLLMSRLGGRAAEKRSNGEEDNAGDEKALPAEYPRKPAGHGEHHGVADQVVGEDPGYLIGAGIEASLHMGEGDVGHGGIDDLHDGREHDGNGDEPFIDRFLT